MSKILIFTDLHAHPHKGTNQRLEDCLKALEWVIKTAQERNIEHILFLGDLFHNREKIEIYTYQKVFEVFHRNFGIGSKQKMWLLLGNHDLWHYEKWDISSVYPFAAIENVTVINQTTRLDFYGYPVSFLPFTHDPIHSLAGMEPEGVLCAHIAIDGAELNTMHGTSAEVSIEHDGDMIKIDAATIAGWKRVFMGHYHGAQQITETIEYVGSPLQLSFGEAFQHKHIVIYDLATDEREYVRNTFSPQHFIVDVADVDKYKLEGNFFKVKVDDISTTDMVDLTTRLGKDTKIGSLKIEEAKTKPSINYVADAKAIMFNEDEMVENYIKEVGHENLEFNKLVDTFKLIRARRIA